ncbi:hypothetical protein ONZ51_g10360 [Trametes cubensis]|uniref:Peptidase S53 domain-containing protein n=1 Tax=Trametes cubensis TaxID=1111947 RepID=A0AAD7TM78_9APHY|nr:hypothetical protein ONZ51_g10360 [Trametes cubensis]
MLKASALLAYASLGVAAATTFTSFHLREYRAAAPRGFIEVGPAPQNKTLSLRLALTESDADGLIDALYSVNQFVSPQPATIEAVNSWLQENGLTFEKLSPAGDWIGINMPVAQANKLFNTNFTIFRHAATGAEVVRTLEYFLPGAIAGHIELVHPTISSDSFPDPTSMRAPYYHIVPSLSPNITTCLNQSTPSCLQELYKIPTAPAVNQNNTLGVSGFRGGAVDPAYIQQFLRTYRPDVNPPANYTIYRIDGDDPDDPGISEGYADLEYTLSLATNVPITYYFVGINQTDGVYGMLDEANALLALDEPPNVLTTSFNLYPESVVSFALTDKLCRAYAQLGARGVTIFIASGDDGAGCSQDNTQFEPKFPLNCPFVTAVGGTQSVAPEEAWPGSSGGFSNYYPRPRYQVAAVTAFLETNGDKYKGLLNASGRGFPDIAAKADPHVIYAGVFYPVVGTSLASPTVACIFALVNDRLVSAGRPPLGFINPWLYKEGYKAFTDITTGESTIMCTENVTNTIEATEGWDPVTGLGTPRFDKLVDLLHL